MLSNEKQLIKDLLDNYAEIGIVGRPVKNTSATITVDFGLALIQILDLDEKNQILNTNVWSRYVCILYSHILVHYSSNCAVAFFWREMPNLLGPPSCKRVVP